MKKVTLALTAAALVVGTTTAGAVYVGQDGGMLEKHAMMADPFGDATITRADAQAKAAEMFAKHDLNRDGKLTKEERRTAMRAQMHKLRAAMHGAMAAPDGGPMGMPGGATGEPD